MFVLVCFFKQKTAYEMRISDWSSDVCSSDLSAQRIIGQALDTYGRIDGVVNNAGILRDRFFFKMDPDEWRAVIDVHLNGTFYMSRAAAPHLRRSEEHTSELQSLMRISYAVFCLKKKNNRNTHHSDSTSI